MTTTPKTDAIYQNHSDHIAELEKDRERINWLMEKVQWRMLPSGFLCYEFVTPMFDGVCSVNIRARIDAAMKLDATPHHSLPSPNAD